MFIMAVHSRIFMLIFYIFCYLKLRVREIKHCPHFPQQFCLLHAPHNELKMKETRLHLPQKHDVV